MKNYKNAKIEIVSFSSYDVVRTSGDSELEWDMD